MVSSRSSCHHLPFATHHSLLTTHDSGFSLLELLLVLAIMAVLTAMAVPRYAASAIRYRADLAAHRIILDFALAQSDAKAASSSRTVVFSIGADSYEIPQLSALDGAAGTYVVDLSERPYEASIVSADFNGLNQVTFSGWGIPSGGGTVVLSVGAEERKVTVEAVTGKATVQ